jgi:hypothetical protein
MAQTHWNNTLAYIADATVLYTVTPAVFKGHSTPVGPSGSTHSGCDSIVAAAALFVFRFRAFVVVQMLHVRFDAGHHFGLVHVSVPKQIIASGRILVSDQSIASGRVRVSDQSIASGRVRVSDQSIASGRVRVPKQIITYGRVPVSDQITATGRVRVSDQSIITERVPRRSANHKCCSPPSANPPHI